MSLTMKRQLKYSSHPIHFTIYLNRKLPNYGSLYFCSHFDENITVLTTTMMTTMLKGMMMLMTTMGVNNLAEQRAEVETRTAWVLSAANSESSI